MKKIAWSLFWILSGTAICSAQNTTLYFPQVADGLQGGGIIWITAIGITNPSLGSAPVNGSITFTQDNGSGMNVAVVNEQGQPVGNGSTIPFQLAGGQTRFFSTTGNGPLNQGFATVTANGAVTGGVAFYQYGNNGTTSLGSAGVLAATPLIQQLIFVLRPSHTAIAIANPGNAIANITFQLFDTNGVEAFPSVQRFVLVKNHTAFFVDQLFPSAAAGFYGTLRITSTSQVTATSLIFDNQFYTIPVIPVQQ